MRNWETHFPDFDVPRFVDYLVDKGVLVDNSGDGDDGPNFDLMKDKLRATTLFIAHPLRYFRDVEDDLGRFVILRYDDAGDVSARFDTDDLEEALVRILEKGDEAGIEALDTFAEEYQAKMNETRSDPPRV